MMYLLFGRRYILINKKLAFIKIFGSGALPRKMLLVRIIANNEIDVHFRSGRLIKG